MRDLDLHVAAGDVVSLAVLLVEQHVAEVLRYADRVYVMRRGRVEISGQPRELAGRLYEVEDSYLGRTGPGGSGQ